MLLRTPPAIPPEADWLLMTELYNKYWFGDKNKFKILKVKDNSKTTISAFQY